MRFTWMGSGFILCIFIYPSVHDRFRQLRFRCRRGGVVPFIPAALAFIYFQVWIKAFVAANIVTVKFWDFLLKHPFDRNKRKHQIPSHTQHKNIPNFSFHFESNLSSDVSVYCKSAWTLFITNQKKTFCLVCIKSIYQIVHGFQSNIWIDKEYFFRFIYNFTIWILSLLRLRLIHRATDIYSYICNRH